MYWSRDQIFKLTKSSTTTIPVEPCGESKPTPYSIPEATNPKPWTLTFAAYVFVFENPFYMFHQKLKPYRVL